MEEDNSDDEDGISSRAPHDLLCKVISGVVKRLTTTRVVATPSGREARQFLTFFVTSMFNPMLQTPPPLVNMMSWTTLVPVYSEDVIYAIRVCIVLLLLRQESTAWYDSRQCSCKISWLEQLCDVLLRS